MKKFDELDSELKHFTQNNNRISNIISKIEDIKNTVENLNETSNKLDLFVQDKLNVYIAETNKFSDESVKMQSKLQDITLNLKEENEKVINNLNENLNKFVLNVNELITNITKNTDSLVVSVNNINESGALLLDRVEKSNAENLELINQNKNEILEVLNKKDDEYKKFSEENYSKILTSIFNNIEEVISVINNFSNSLNNIISSTQEKILNDIKNNFIIEKESMIETITNYYNNSIYKVELVNQNVQIVNNLVKDSLVKIDSNKNLIITEGEKIDKNFLTVLNSLSQLKHIIDENYKAEEVNIKHLETKIETVEESLNQIKKSNKWHILNFVLLIILIASVIFLIFNTYK